MISSLPANGREAYTNPVVASDTFEHLWTMADAMRVPSTLHATDLTSPECPSSVSTASPVVASHTLTLMS